VPSRIPAPRNITEIGGYINLLETLNQPELRAQTLASILGVAGSNPPLGWSVGGPVLFNVTRMNDRPSGAQQATISLQYSIRSDFASAFDTAMQEIHDRGCQLPILSPVRSLPSANGTTPPPSDLLRYLGRTLDLVPSAALNDPDADALALARPAGGNLQVVALQLDPTASKAATVNAANWTAWDCNATSCQETTATRTYLPLAPILNAAGWYQPVPSAPTSLSRPGNWMRWINITGLVTGTSLYGEELGLLASQTEVAASSLRECLLWIWNGTEFAPMAS